ncbi:MAG: STAS domain-containing protein [Chloroflexota bacterium]
MEDKNSFALASHTVGDVSVLALTGRFDAYTANKAKDWLEQATDGQPAHIVVNLEDVTFVDSTALATLVQGMKHSRQKNGDLRLCNLQQKVRIIFELTRLDRAFEIFPGEDEAIRAFAQ